MKNIYFTADSHFNHKPYVTFCIVYIICAFAVL